jgi:hypothetical protein
MGRKKMGAEEKWEREKLEREKWARKKWTRTECTEKMGTEKKGALEPKKKKIREPEEGGRARPYPLFGQQEKHKGGRNKKKKEITCLSRKTLSSFWSSNLFHSAIFIHNCLFL